MFNIQVQSNQPPEYYWQLKFSLQVPEIGWKNEVSLTDDFNSLAGVYHQYVFKYEKLWKYIQLFKSYSTK